ncbi:MAG TPA: tRNA pseudouridine(13) synthase TruD [Gammaproteobacteria bacterium]|nr:tRNA pseudouridine(13) synthase TruD [Gammaproteobacteria bacterium]
MLDTAIHALAYAWGKPLATARMREQPEDFQVTEIPLLEPDGAGEHVWLWIRKRGENTLYVAEQLSTLAGVHPRQVSFAGLKDRHAVTEQWFSVQLSGKDEPHWEDMSSDTVTILRHARHSRKLRRGALKGNTFRIMLRDIEGDRDEIDQRLTVIAREGVPNYFGEQRFGRDGSNLQTADSLFKNPKLRLSRNKRSLTLSAARSLLFNQVLSARVNAGNWNAPLAGDAMQLDGSHSYFIAASVDAELSARVASQDIHPTGPLHGRGENPAQGACRELEAAVLAELATWCAGLEAAGLKQDRRALRLGVTDLAWQWGPSGELVLTFSLPAGAYATSVLREVVQADTAGGG